VNSYPVYKDFEALDRRSRIPDSMSVGNATGGMATATAFGLTRAVNELNADTGRSTAREKLDAGSTPGSGAYHWYAINRRMHPAP
jgi:hypothetical protein